MRSDWTEEQIAQLRELVEKKLTLSQMASLLGRSRNAVAGKLLRLGLKSLSGIVTGIPKKAKPKPEKRPAPVQMPRPMPAPVRRMRPEDVPPGNGTYPDSLLCQFLEGDVPRRGFRVAHGNQTGKRRIELVEPRLSFGKPHASWEDVPRCNNERVPGRPYCAKHSLLCFEFPGLEKEQPE